MSNWPTPAMPAKASRTTRCGPIVATTISVRGPTSRLSGSGRSRLERPDLARGQELRLDQAGDLVGHGSQRNTEPARQVGDGLLAVRVQENRSEDLGLRRGPEHRKQS